MELLNERGQGYFNDIEDIENVVVKASDDGVPVTVGDLGFVQLGTQIRRGMLDENGQGEAVGGVVVMRHGENAKEVIERVKKKIEEIEPGLPAGVTIESAYDRSKLIDKSVETLTHSLTEEAIVVSLIILLFLFHVRSSLVVVLTLPVAVLIGFIFMKQMGITSNIMSLGGIAIAVGVIVDASIVMVENAYRKLANERLSILIPLALLIILMLLYVTFKNFGESLVVMLSVPFALIGGVWLLYLMGLNFSVAVWVGFIALFGVAVETGVVMLVYLNEALDERLGAKLREMGIDPKEATGTEVARAIDTSDVHQATVDGAALRLRPKLMTAATTLIGLTPLLWATGTGADVMKPIAVPMVGGMLSSVALVLIVIPVIFDLMKRRELRKRKLTYSGLEH